MKPLQHIRTILGIDPGTNITGYGIITNQSTPIIIDAGVIDLRKIDNHHEKLRQIFSKLYTLITHYDPQYMSIEAPFYGKNIQSMLKLGRAQGVALTCAMLKGLETEEYSPKKIKQSVTGNGNSSKEQLAAMLSQILETDLSKYPLDATDALSTAYCHYLHLSSPLGKSSKKFSSWSDYINDNPDKVS